MMLLIPIMMMTLLSYGIGHERTNVLFIIVDDLRPVLGAYGDTKAHTPYIDLLASESVLFQHAYAQQALCAPSRNSFLTSRRPDTIGLYDFYSYWRNVAGNFTTLPEHMKNNGYVTASFGKVFHPGQSCNHSDDSPYSWSRTPFHPSTEKYKDAPVCPQRNSIPADNLICPVQVSIMPNNTLPDIEMLLAAKQFLRERLEPFFMAVGFQKPHIPFKYPKRYLKFHPLKKFSLPDNYEWPKNVSSVAYNSWMDLRKRSDVEKLKLNCPWEKIPEKFAKKIIQSYYAAVTYVDDLIGDLLVELNSLNLKNKTIVILTSDHGWALGEHTVWAKYSNFEVALRVPLLISVPYLTHQSQSNLKSRRVKHYEHYNRTKVVHEPVELLDIFPTIAELTGFPIPLCPRRSSSSLMPELCTEGKSLVRFMNSSVTNTITTINNTAISQYPRPEVNPTCKSSTDKPRLRCISIMGYTIRTIQYRYTVWTNFSHIDKRPNWQEVVSEEFYNHKIDSEENSNLAYKEIYQKMKNLLKSMLIKRF